MRMFAIVSVLAVSLVSLCGLTPALGDTATCESIGQDMINLQTGVNGAVLAATKATLAASTLPGTVPRRNPNYQVVEDEAPKVEANVGTALSGLGPLVDADFDNNAIQNATEAVTLEARAELQEALAFGRLSLRFEQIIEARRRLAARLALADALRAFGSSMTSTVSNTYGDVNGQYFSSTTITRSPSIPQPIQIAPDATVEETAEALSQEEARLLFLGYTFNPLVQHWIATCRGAHQLPPAPVATP